MGKKKKEEMDKQRERFRRGASRRGLTERKAAKIFDLIGVFLRVRFQQVPFGRLRDALHEDGLAQGASSGGLHGGAMTSDMGDTNRLIVLLDECRNLGISVHPPDVNSGDAGFGLKDGGNHLRTRGDQERR